MEKIVDVTRIPNVTGSWYSIPLTGEMTNGDSIHVSLDTELMLARVSDEPSPPPDLDFLELFL